MHETNFKSKRMAVCKKFKDSLKEHLKFLLANQAKINENKNNKVVTKSELENIIKEEIGKAKQK